MIDLENVLRNDRAFVEIGSDEMRRSSDKLDTPVVSPVIGAGALENRQKGMVDVSPFISSDKTVKGDSDKGKTRFENSCKHCHGEDGKQIKIGHEDEPESVGDVAKSNPWEFFHKTSFAYDLALQSIKILSPKPSDYFCSHF